jgi:hypothetical protein
MGLQRYADACTAFAMNSAHNLQIVSVCKSMGLSKAHLWQIILFNNLEISYGFSLNESAEYFRMHVTIEEKHVLAKRVAAREDCFIPHQTAHTAGFRLYTGGLFLSQQT